MLANWVFGGFEMYVVQVLLISILNQIGKFGGEMSFWRVYDMNIGKVLLTRIKI